MNYGSFEVAAQQHWTQSESFPIQINISKNYIYICFILYTFTYCAVVSCVHRVVKYIRKCKYQTNNNSICPWNRNHIHKTRHHVITATIVFIRLFLSGFIQGHTNWFAIFRPPIQDGKDLITIDFVYIMYGLNIYIQFREQMCRNSRGTLALISSRPTSTISGWLM